MADYEICERCEYYGEVEYGYGTCISACMKSNDVPDPDYCPYKETEDEEN